MQYVKLGNSGLDISPICIGCMGFGDPSKGHPAWSLQEERRVIHEGLGVRQGAKLAEGEWLDSLHLNAAQLQPRRP